MKQVTLTEREWDFIFRLVQASVGIQTLYQVGAFSDFDEQALYEKFLAAYGSRSLGTTGKTTRNIEKISTKGGIELCPRIS